MAKVEVEKLLEGLDLTPEQRKVFEEAYGNEANLEVASRRYLRRSEGSRLAQEAAEAKRQADEARAKADAEYRDSEAYRQTLTEWEQSKAVEFAEKEQALATEKARYDSVLRSQNIDPASALGKELSDENAQRFRDAQASNKALDDRLKDKLDISMARTIADVAMTLPLEMPKVMARYQKLHGDISRANWDEFQEKAKAGIVKGVSVLQTAEDYFGFAAKEQEIAAQAVEDRIAREVEEQVTARLSTMKVPGAAINPNAPDNKIFTNDFAEHKAGQVVEAPATQAELNDFNAVNAELQKQGIHMEW